MSKKFLMIEAVVLGFLVTIYWFTGHTGRGEAPLFEPQKSQTQQEPARDYNGNTVDLERPEFLDE